MKIKQTLIALIMLLGVVMVLATPSQTYAATCGGVKTAVFSCETKGQATCKDGTVVDKDVACADGSKPVPITTDTGAFGILLTIINVLTAGVGIMAVGGIVYGSILYTSAGGSVEQVKKAMGVFTNVVIGIVAYAIMYAFLNFIIPGGVFN